MPDSLFFTLRSLALFFCLRPPYTGDIVRIDCRNARPRAHDPTSMTVAYFSDGVQKFPYYLTSGLKNGRYARVVFFPLRVGRSRLPQPAVPRAHGCVGIEAKVQTPKHHNHPGVKNREANSLCARDDVHVHVSADRVDAQRAAGYLKKEIMLARILAPTYTHTHTLTAVRC